MTELDFIILDTLHNALSCVFLDFVLPIITSLGNGGALWIALGLLLTAHPKYRRQGIGVLLALLIGFIICNLILKPLIARPRPCQLRADLPLLIPCPEGFSFPSGHTTSSFAAAEALRRANRKFGYISYPIACIIAFSRLYLYVHFPTDVIFGAIIGLLCGICSSYIVKNKSYRIR